MSILRTRQFGALVFGALLSIVAGAACAAGNWVINPGFDTSLGGWSVFYDQPATWNASDARDLPDSGSVLITNRGTSHGGSQRVLGQCVPVSPSTAYTLGGRTRIPAGQPPDTWATYVLFNYPSTDCSGADLSMESFGGSGTGTWEQLSTNITTGATTHSVSVELSLYKPSGVTLDASGLFDDIVLRRSGLPFAVDPSMSASWYNPAQSGHGITLEFLGSTSAWMCWFTFDLTGNRSWICGLGNVSGNTVSFPGAFVVTGGRFPPAFDPAAISEVPWGSITIAFAGCNAGTMSWTTSAAGYLSGSMPLSRLTTLWANGCS